MKFIKKWIAAHKEKKLTRKIEKALGFKLTEWQKEYIFCRTAYKPTGRQQGKTTAHIIHRLVMCDTPLEFFRLVTLVQLLTKNTAARTRLFIWKYLKIFTID